MSKKEKKEKKIVITDADNPSLIVVSENTRLRVLEDFWVDQNLPKWKGIKERWNKIKQELGCNYIDSEASIDKYVSALKKTEEEKAVIRERAIALMAMNKALDDDRYHIREKHEREVRESVLKNAKYICQLGFWDRVRNLLSKKKIVPVEIAMTDLIEHIETTSTEELSSRIAKVREIEANLRRAGQYKKADAVKSYGAILVEEMVVANAGFTDYVTEDMMIDFIRKSERGTSVDFLSLYEDEIPKEAIEKKLAADALMVFDNYVVAHYSDLIRKAAKAKKETSDEEEKKVRQKRRDPILFGIIKNSRKLYYICDWETDTDDLTLEKLEKELGVTRGSLVENASTITTSSANVYNNATTVSLERRIRNEVRDQVADTLDMIYANRRGRMLFNEY